MATESASRVADVERLRPRLTGLAYRMLGSFTDAEDVVQDVAVRYLDHDRAAAVRVPDHYLTAMTARACIDRARSAQRRREVYVGPWLPEPVRDGDAATPDPHDALERAEAISMAFLVILQTLSPLERAALILHDVLDYDYAEVSTVLGRSEAACRQLVSRARGHVRRGHPRFAASTAATQELTERFLWAARSGNVDALVELLAGDATLWVDGGGNVAAATHPITGAERVARYWVGLFRKLPTLAATVEAVNGAPAIILSYAGTTDGVVSLAVQAGRIVGVYNQRNPEKLAHLRAG